MPSIPWRLQEQGFVTVAVAVAFGVVGYQAHWIVCVSLWLEKAVEARYVHDKRACLPPTHAVTLVVFYIGSPKSRD
jgi:hypothetical protein